MTIDEAIKHCEEYVEQYEKKAMLTCVTLEQCKCAEEHYHLAEWLKELKHYKEQPEIVRCENCQFSSTYIYCGELYWTCNNPEGLNRDVSENSYCSAVIKLKGSR